MGSWTSGHIENEKAWTLNEDMACNDLLTPLDAMGNKIDDWAFGIISTK